MLCAVKSQQNTNSLVFSAAQCKLRSQHYAAPAPQSSFISFQYHLLICTSLMPLNWVFSPRIHLKICTGIRCCILSQARLLASSHVLTTVIIVCTIFPTSGQEKSTHKTTAEDILKFFQNIKVQKSNCWKFTPIPNKFKKKLKLKQHWEDGLQADSVCESIYTAVGVGVTSMTCQQEVKV